MKLYFVILTDWVHWEKKVEEYVFPAYYEQDFYSILVPNVDNVRMIYLINLIMKQNKVLCYLEEFSYFFGYLTI